MIRFNLEAGTGIAIGADCYRFIERVRDPHRSPVFHQIGTGVARTIPDREIETLIERQEIKFLSATEIAEAEANGGEPKGRNVVFLDDIKSEWERERVQRYDQYIQGWVRAGRPPLTDRKLKSLIAGIARKNGDPKPPCTRTLRRLVSAWLFRGCTLEGLLSSKNLCGSKPQIATEVREIVLDVIWDEYLTLERPAVTDCYQSLRTRITELNRQLVPGSKRHPLPSLQQMHREIGKLDKFTIMELREGPRAARLKFTPRYGGVQVAKHNQRWELDSTVVDLILVDPVSGLVIGRPTLTIAIDCYTRTIVGFHVGWEAESFLTLTATLQNALQPKGYIHELYPEIKHKWENLGPPEYLAVDNHSAYVGDDCKAACKQLGIDLHYTPVLKPWYRPLVERFFNTITHKIFQRVPGTTFSNIFERNGEVPPETIATTTLDELRAVITMWIADEYHYTRHRGIRTTPALLWQESTRLHATVPPPSLERMKTALALIVERVPQHYGIEWEGLLYNKAVVGNLIIAPGRPRKVRIAINPNDLSAIMMRHPILEQWLPIPLVKPELAPNDILTYSQHSLTKQLLKERTDEFLGDDSYEAARKHVAKLLTSKRTDNALADRRRAARFQFTERHSAPSPTKSSHEQTNAQISSDIFGDQPESGDFGSSHLPGEQDAPEAPLEQPESAGDAQLSLGEAQTPKRRPERPKTPIPAVPVKAIVLVQTDDTLDLDAAAAKLGVKTHSE